MCLDGSSTPGKVVLDPPNPPGIDLRVIKAGRTNFLVVFVHKLVYYCFSYCKFGKWPYRAPLSCFSIFFDLQYKIDQNLFQMCLDGSSTPGEIVLPHPDLSGIFLQANQVRHPFFLIVLLQDVLLTLEIKF